MIHVNEKDIDSITEKIYAILNGKDAEPVSLPDDFPDNEVRQLVHYINRLFEEYSAVSKALFTLSRGELDFVPPKGKMGALQSLKNLHANLRHLTWKTQQIAKGDFSQSVDFMGEFSIAFNTMTSQLHEAFDKIEEQNRVLEERNKIIQNEREKSEKLLLNILPERVANELKQTGQTVPVLFDNVTVLFSDFVNFTNLSSSITPAMLIEDLNEIFTQFDQIFESHSCERIKTIGDAYLAVCGMPIPNDNHARNIVRAASDVVSWLEKRNLTALRKWQTRIGIHSGPVIGAVVGTTKYIYDIFGDTVNTASRMESNSEPMRINISESTMKILGENCSLQERSPVEIKGKGIMSMYFLDSISNT